jgi:hypothetical protein
MVIGAILQASSYSRAQIIVGRIVSGMGMGVINSTVPVVQAEFSPKATRGVCEFTNRNSNNRETSWDLSQPLTLEYRCMRPAVDAQLWYFLGLLD